MGKKKKKKKKEPTLTPAPTPTSKPPPPPLPPPGPNQGYIVRETPRGSNRTISIFAIVIASFGTIVAMLALIIAWTGSSNLSEFSEWGKVINKTETDAAKMDEKIEAIEKVTEEMKKKVKQIEETAQFIYRDLNVAEEEFKRFRDKTAKGFGPYVTEKTSEEDEEDKEYEEYEEYEEDEELLAEFGEAAEQVEELGGLVTHADYYNHGRELHSTGKYEEALKAFDKAIELKSDFVGAWVDKGVILSELGLYEYALKVFGKVIVLAPDNVFSWQKRARIYSMIGEKEKALSDLKKAIELDIIAKKAAKIDVAFKGLWDDDEFKRLVE